MGHEWDHHPIEEGIVEEEDTHRGEDTAHQGVAMGRQEDRQEEGCEDRRPRDGMAMVEAWDLALCSGLK